MKGQESEGSSRGSLAGGEEIPLFISGQVMCNGDLNMTVVFLLQITE